MQRLSDYDFDIDGEAIDLRSTDKTYLIGCKLRVDTRLADIRSQVNDAKRTFASGGRASDRDWLQRAESAISVLGKASQVIQARLAEIKDAARIAAIARTTAVAEAKAARVPAAREHGAMWAQAFVDAARTTLDIDTFTALCRLAHAVVGPKKD